MRPLTSFLVAHCCLLGLCVAQDAAPTAINSDVRPVVLESYLVQLTEYRTESTGPSRTAADIVESLTNSRGEKKQEPIQIIRLSTLSGAESMVQFGRQVSVTTGTTSSRGATTRQMQDVQVGTIVRVTATPQDGKVLLKLVFESSRLEGEGTDDSPPDISRIAINTTQLLEFGKPTLVGSTTAGQTSFVLLTVAR